MGQFSWLSVDSEVPIYNDRPEGYQTVTMVYKDEDGNIKRAIESNYEGYGEFEGVDFYDAVAWMNGIKLPEDNETQELRSLGIDFYFSESSGEFPQLYLGEPPLDSEIYFTIMPQDDPNQGWSHQERDNDYDDFDTYLDDSFDDYDDDYDDDDEYDDDDDSFEEDDD